MGINTKLAKCCNPLTDLPIKGYLTKGGIITVHCSRCKSLLKLDSKRYVSVHWKNNE